MRGSRSKGSRAQGAAFSKHIPSLALGDENRLGDHPPLLPSSLQVPVTEGQALCPALCVCVCVGASVYVCVVQYGACKCMYIVIFYDNI